MQGMWVPGSPMPKLCSYLTSFWKPYPSLEALATQSRVWSLLACRRICNPEWPEKRGSDQVLESKTFASAQAQCALWPQGIPPVSTLLQSHL